MTVQREIVKYVIGTHQTLIRHFPEVAKFRQENWRSWLDGGENSELYRACHLTDIAIYFWNV